MEDMYEAILKYMPAPEGDFDAPPKMLISTIDYNEYIGRIGVGKVESGIIAVWSLSIPTLLFILKTPITLKNKPFMLMDFPIGFSSASKSVL